ncbi:MAG: hypothetical protein ACK5WB_08905 [Phycisphaerales bacterium]|jgi:hypothetical protein|nr:hypothetical protein [Phycisphaeraceae bacterium]
MGVVRVELSRNTRAEKGGVGRAALWALVASAGLGGMMSTPAMAQDRRVFLQWFENSWTHMERRAPDLFMAGYGALWLPSPSKASFNSPGYDVFDRFDLGSPGSETTYGTEAYWRSMVQEMKAANVELYPESIMNHNGGRTNDPGFLAAGGWPGFYQPGTGADPWGDFNDGTTQSYKPQDANYNLFDGDLVGLQDIAQAKNYRFIRHPVTATPPAGQVNLPAGTIRNRPDPNNARFYPDNALTPLTFTNPSDGQNWTIYPYNLANPLAGDAYMENATGLLSRWTQWMLEVQGVDGFRLDAAKHIPQWFWNNYYDPMVFQRRTLPWGAKGNAYSFGESVESNAFVQTYIRNKDGFGNRDALDLNEAGALRDILNARGFGSWTNALNASIDQQDNGFNDGSQGVHHLNSHDNGSVGNGSSAPGIVPAANYGLPQLTYVLFRSGYPLVYYNAREMHDRFSNRGFWPREGNPTALGNFDNNLRRLTQMANSYVRADNANVSGLPRTYFYVLNGTDTVNPSQADVLVFERTNFLATDPARNQIGVNAAANVLVGVNDRYDNGFQQRSIQTSFPPGTRLWELTGAATDPVVNAGGAIPQVMTVDNNRRVFMTIPNNTNINGVQHHRGLVAYGPIAPAGTLSVLNIQPGGARTAPTQIAPDPESTPTWRRRLTAVDVITTPTFEIRLDTTKADPSDPNHDDFAVFRIGKGYVDYNGNGNYDQPLNAWVDAGAEQFLTQRSPISGPGGTGTTGVYRQVINTSQFSEGYHYLSVVCYRRRTDGGSAIFSDFRKVFYVDRSPPNVQLLAQQAPSGGGQFEFRVQANDRTTNAVHIIPNLPISTDPLTVVSSANQAYQYDRQEWRRNVGALPAGNNSITVVAYEASGNVSVQRYENIQVAIGSGDVNLDGLLNIDDLYAHWRLGVPTGTYQPEADVLVDGVVNNADRITLTSTLRQQEALRMEGSQR